MLVCFLADQKHHHSYTYTSPNALFSNSQAAHRRNDGGSKIGRSRGAVRVEIGPFLNRSKHALGDEAFRGFSTWWNVMSLSKIEFMGLTACYDVGKVSDLNEWRFPCSWPVTAFGNMRTQTRTTWSLLLPFYLLALFLFEHSECLLGQFSDYALCETKHVSKLVQTLNESTQNRQTTFQTEVFQTFQHFNEVCSWL